MRWAAAASVTWSLPTNPELPQKARSHRISRRSQGRAGQKVWWSEFRSNDVYRQVDTPKDIDPQSVSASIHNGMLKIVATKTEKPVRTIPISSAAA
jgi:HSP20 family molecular chaperone IbpA